MFLAAELLKNSHKLKVRGVMIFPRTQVSRNTPGTPNLAWA